MELLFAPHALSALLVAIVVGPYVFSERVRWSWDMERHMAIHRMEVSIAGQDMSTILDRISDVTAEYSESTKT